MLRADFWVYDATFKRSEVARFNSSRSSTYKKQAGNVNEGLFKGFSGMDNVNIGGLTIKDIKFLQINSVDNSTFSIPNDGFMSLAYSNNIKPEVRPPLMTAIDKGFLPNKLFTVNVKGPFGDNKETQQGGRLVLGDYDNQNCGKVLGWAKFTSRSIYQVQVDSISYGGKPLINKPKQGKKNKLT
uniref:Peptidase A1 domain-containing protein n=1 Tax=Meloidogyne hapla TaxID=6305 RepID=A0A1I8BWA8_MELHA